MHRFLSSTFPGRIRPPCARGRTFARLCRALRVVAFPAISLLSPVVSARSSDAVAEPATEKRGTNARAADTSRTDTLIADARRTDPSWPDDRAAHRSGVPSAPAVVRAKFVVAGSGFLRPGTPLDIALDFSGGACVADGSPGRILLLPSLDVEQTIEFASPPGLAGFYPTGVAVRGFFVYALDESSRRLLRFDNRGAFRDVLLEFDEQPESRRASPWGLAVDETGRVAITDVENHQVMLIDNYLVIQVVFGGYGTHDGQFDTPRDVAFAKNGDLLVADTGNRRIQRFSDGGAFLARVPSRPIGILRRPVNVTETSRRNVVVADPVVGAVVVFRADGSFLTAFVPERSEENGDSNAGSFEPVAVASGRDGSLVVADGRTGVMYVFGEF